jgi:hypothetical protein
VKTENNFGLCTHFSLKLDDLKSTQEPTSPSREEIIQRLILEKQIKKNDKGLTLIVPCLFRNGTFHVLYRIFCLDCISKIPIPQILILHNPLRNISSLDRIVSFLHRESRTFARCQRLECNLYETESSWKFDTLCPFCKNAVYCSPECQKLDFKVHNIVCNSWIQQKPQCYNHPLLNPLDKTPEEKEKWYQMKDGKLKLQKEIPKTTKIPIGDKWSEEQKWLFLAFERNHCSFFNCSKEVPCCSRVTILKGKWHETPVSIPVSFCSRICSQKLSARILEPYDEPKLKSLLFNPETLKQIGIDISPTSGTGAFF